MNNNYITELTEMFKTLQTTDKLVDTQALNKIMKTMLYMYILENRSKKNGIYPLNLSPLQELQHAWYFINGVNATLTDYKEQ